MSGKPLRPAATYGEILGRLIVHFRDQRQMNQKQLADTIGVSQSALSRMETGTSPMTVAHLVGIAQALQLDPSYIVQSADRAHKQLASQGVHVQIENTDPDKGLLFLGAAALMGLVIATIGKR